MIGWLELFSRRYTFVKQITTEFGDTRLPATYRLAFHSSMWGETGSGTKNGGGCVLLDIIAIIGSVSLFASLYAGADPPSGELDGFPVNSPRATAVQMRLRIQLVPGGIVR